MADTQTGQSACSCQCSPVILSSLTRLPVMSNIFVSGDSYTAGSQSTYMPVSADSPFFCSPLGVPGNNFRDSSDTWRPLTQNSIYDPASVALYPYRPSYGGLDLNGRRKNATRESTTTLKAWLHEHMKNPYPTKGEKIMLAIITKMTLTQVSTWFANARRRLKKENRISGSPRHRSDDGGDDDLDIFVSGDVRKNIKLKKEHSLEDTDTSTVTRTDVTVSSGGPPSVTRPSSTDVQANTCKLSPTLPEAQTYIAHDKSASELDSGKRKIWSVIEFLNTTSHNEKLEFAKSEKSKMCPEAKFPNSFRNPMTNEKPGRQSALCDNQSSIHRNSCDNQSPIHPTSCDIQSHIHPIPCDIQSPIHPTSGDNQFSQRQSSSRISRPHLSTYQSSLSYLQDGVYARPHHLVQRL